MIVIWADSNLLKYQFHNIVEESETELNLNLHHPPNNQYNIHLCCHNVSGVLYNYFH